PNTFHTKKESSEADALAVGRGDVFHGVWRHIRDGRDYSWRRLWSRDSDFALLAGALEPANGFHDRRAFKCASTGRWILRVGSPRTRKFLGLSGSMVVSRCQYLRHGHLSDAVCDLSKANGALVWNRQSWNLGRAFCSVQLRGPEHCRHSRGRNYVAVAVLPFVGALRIDRCSHSISFGAVR